MNRTKITTGLLAATAFLAALVAPAAPSEAAGNTLVVETTNFNGKTGARGNGNNFPMSESLRLVERFTRLDANTLQYEVTINDPKTWVRTWKVAYPLKLDPDYQLFEYACHEGNHAMTGILAGARMAEKEAAEQATNKRGAGRSTR